MECRQPPASACGAGNAASGESEFGFGLPSSGLPSPGHSRTPLSTVAQEPAPASDVLVRVFADDDDEASGGPVVGAADEPREGGRQFAFPGERQRRPFDGDGWHGNRFRNARAAPPRLIAGGLRRGSRRGAGRRWSFDLPAAAQSFIDRHQGRGGAGFALGQLLLNGQLRSLGVKDG